MKLEEIRWQKAKRRNRQGMDMRHFTLLIVKVSSYIEGNGGYNRLYGRQLG